MRNFVVLAVRCVCQCNGKRGRFTGNKDQRGNRKWARTSKARLQYPVKKGKAKRSMIRFVSSKFLCAYKFIFRPRNQACLMLMFCHAVWLGNQVNLWIRLWSKAKRAFWKWPASEIVYDLLWSRFWGQLFVDHVHIKWALVYSGFKNPILTRNDAFDFGLRVHPFNYTIVYS